MSPLRISPSPGTPGEGRGERFFGRPVTPISPATSPTLTRQNHKPRPLVLPPQLSASRIDISAPGFTHVGVHAPAPQDFLELHYVLRRRPAVRQPRHLVVPNEIHVSPDRLADFHQLLRVFRPVVDPRQQDVFE